MEENYMFGTAWTLISSVEKQKNNISNFFSFLLNEHGSQLKC